MWTEAGMSCRRGLEYVNCILLQRSKSPQKINLKDAQLKIATLSNSGIYLQVYKCEPSHKAEEITKNICGAKGEVAVQEISLDLQDTRQ